MYIIGIEADAITKSNKAPDEINSFLPEFKLVTDIYKGYVRASKVSSEIYCSRTLRSVSKLLKPDRTQSSHENEIVLTCFLRISAISLGS
ncbi:MAG: hypothetical protein BWY22_02333 [Bacteroidetes bacterium ADurb.Bin217]|nr:MAG: hypothetical protein BWY22_02333 [Bacteroidetes bacterium ADurb.Bin217]